MLANGVTLNESACHLSVPPFVCLRVLMAAYKDTALERELSSFRSAFIGGQDGPYYTESHGFFYVKPTSGLL